mmetsp:Transcript_67673/g.130690  ORF Transcript_67673/g.130690 Transcript_67673/m.130690 type:complete len:94 (-) Transcript_67673:1040-1321(-)
MQLPKLLLSSKPAACSIRHRILGGTRQDGLWEAIQSDAMKTCSMIVSGALRKENFVELTLMPPGSYNIIGQVGQSKATQRSDNLQSSRDAGFL